jgi:CDP-2,3-bis-(O-geranylgeranyl)-sn-glycerol synthase
MLIQLKLLALLLIANGAPIVVGDVLHRRWVYPVDGGLRLPDGQALFGPAKTWRGLLSVLVFTVPCGMLLGFTESIGVLLAGGVILGDLTSSFIKRRLRIAPSNQALGLDQIPEALFPLLAVQGYVALNAGQIMMLVLAFIVIELLLSRLLFKLHLRDRPY